MKLETTYLKPSPFAFFGLLTLSIVTLFLLGAIIHNVMSANPWELKFFGGWTLLAFAIANSIGVTIASRRFQLTITDTTDLENAKNWALEFLSKNGLKTKEEKENETILESAKSFYKLFYNWFGTEATSVKRSDNKVVVEGPFRLIDSLYSSVDSKLRFGKSVN